MEYLALTVIAALVFGVCYLFDKGFEKLFRSKAQHKTGLAVRLSRRYAAFGAILMALAVAAVLTGLGSSPVLLVGGILVGIGGICLVVYYASYGIFYDDDSFLYNSLGKKSASYRFRDILGQQLYLLQGGSVVVELHMKDGRSVSIQSTMDGARPFLDAAFAGWCRQTGKKPQDCSFHNPAEYSWFPSMEET